MSLAVGFSSGWYLGHDVGIRRLLAAALWCLGVAGLPRTLSPNFDFKVPPGSDSFFSVGREPRSADQLGASRAAMHARVMAGMIFRPVVLACRAVPSKLVVEKVKEGCIVVVPVFWRAQYVSCLHTRAIQSVDCSTS